MMLVNASAVSKSFSERLLFENVSFHIESGDKIGFIGANGTGKSTLFKILTGESDFDSGEVFKNKQLKIGYLDQYSCSKSKLNLYDEMLSAYDDVLALEQELNDINFDIESGNGNLESLINRQNVINNEIEMRDGFFFRNKVRSTLLGLGFCEDEFTLPVSKLSGGQKTRVELGKILLSDVNLLLLDEPTNHLDIASVEWLEEFLKSYKHGFIVISHDRYFLDRVTSKTFELDNTRFFTYNGNYSFYMAQKEVDRLTEQRKYENTKKEIERLEGIVEQQRRWNREKNIKTAESKQKVIDKLEQDLVQPQKMPDNMFYDFKAYQGGGNDVLEVKDLEMKFEGEPLFQNANMFIKKGEKVFLLGPNGCGKTTFLKIILGILEQTEGSLKLGTDIHIGYYDQIQENLSIDKNIFDEISDEYPHMTQTQIRNALAAFQFKGEDVFKQISTLSGGERARVELAKLILRKVNFLIMDEPTNHLDIAARESLEKALMEYGGTMLMVSHDRYFINKLADRIVYLSKDGMVNYLGNYDEFTQKYNDVKEQTPKNDKISDYKERKRAEAEKRKTLNAYARTEKEISELENKIDILADELSDCGSDYVKAAELTEMTEAAEGELMELYERLEELEKEVKEKEYNI